jgi:biopolymer transport protein ExbD
MRDERESSGGAGIVIAAVAVVLILLLCGGGALLLAGLFVYRVSAPQVAPPPAVSAVPAPSGHADILSIEADGSLLWNESPIVSGELRQRLDELKNAGGPPRSVIVRSDIAAPAGSREEVVQLLSDRGVSFIMEDAR